MLFSLLCGEATSVIKGFIWAFILKCLFFLLLLPALWYGAKWTINMLIADKVETAKSAVATNFNEKALDVKNKINKLKSSFNKDNNK